MPKQYNAVKPRLYSTRRGLEAVKNQGRPPSPYDQPPQQKSTDTQRAMLTPGEYVLPKWLVNDIRSGQPPHPGRTPDYMRGNEQPIPGFAAGGGVPGGGVPFGGLPFGDPNAPRITRAREGDRVLNPSISSPPPPRPSADPRRGPALRQPPMADSSRPGAPTVTETPSQERPRWMHSRGQSGGTYRQTRFPTTRAGGMARFGSNNYTGEGLWRTHSTDTGSERRGREGWSEADDEAHERGRVARDAAVALAAASRAKRYKRETGRTWEETGEEAEKQKQKQEAYDAWFAQLTGAEKQEALAREARAGIERPGNMLGTFRRSSSGLASEEPAQPPFQSSSSGLHDADDDDDDESIFDFLFSDDDDDDTRTAALTAATGLPVGLIGDAYDWATDDAPERTAALAELEGRGAAVDQQEAENRQRADDSDRTTDEWIERLLSEEAPQFEEADFDREEAEIEAAARKAMGDALIMAGEQASAAGLPLGTAQAATANVTADVSAKQSLAKAHRFAQMRMQNMRSKLQQYQTRARALGMAAQNEADRGRAYRLHDLASQEMDKSVALGLEMQEFMAQLNTRSWWESIMDPAGEIIGEAGKEWGKEYAKNYFTKGLSDKDE